MILQVADLEVRYGPIQVLQGVNFAVARGQIVTLVGSNGAGKSTTLRAITGLVTPSRGAISFLGEEIQGLPPHAVVRRGLALCPEGRRIFANLTVWENLLLGAYGRKDRQGLRQDLEWLYHLFPRLEERQSQRAGTLSGGEQQMLALGRALMSRPQLLLLDEPSLGLAPLLVQEVFQIIESLNRKGVTIFLVEQNAFAALNIAHYGYVLENGRLVLEGPAADLLSLPALRHAYLGEEREESGSTAS